MNCIEVINEYENEVFELDTMKNFIEFCTKELNLEDVMFNIIIVDNKKIHELNKNYRKIDRPTDVITFALEDYKDGIDLGFRLLGDIYISYDKVIEQANEYKHSLKRELCFLAVHGLLHLLGYDHMTKEEEKIMFDLQRELLEKYGIKKES